MKSMSAMSSMMSTVHKESRNLRYLVTISLLVTGVVHLLPLVGIFGSERLTALYGLPFHEPNLAILMRHRAVLFGILGVFLLIAAFRPRMQGAALAAGLASVLSFLVLAWMTGTYNAQIARVVVADLVALVLLIIGAAGWRLSRPSRSSSD